MFSEEEGEFGLSLSDMSRALKGSDKAAFADLMTKAVSALNEESGGLVGTLQERVRRLEQTLQTMSATRDNRAKQLREAWARIAQLEAANTEMRTTLGATDSERAAALLAENDRLKATVKVQREMIAGYERETGIGRADLIRREQADMEIREAAIAISSAVNGLN